MMIQREEGGGEENENGANISRNNNLAFDPEDEDGTKRIVLGITRPNKKKQKLQNSTPSFNWSWWLLLCSFFGLGSSSWVLVNAVYAQIPLIVISFGYDYTIISKMTLCITTTSLIPILWTTAIVPFLERGNNNRNRTQNQQQQKRLYQRNDDNNDGNSSNNEPHQQHFYWTTTVGIAMNLMIGLGVALGVVFSPTATTELSSLLVVSFCSGIVGTMSLVLYFPHAASTTMTSPKSSFSVSNVASKNVVDDVVSVEDEIKGEETTRNTTSDTSSCSFPANTALQQTTAMASGTAVANLFIGVLAIIQFNVVPSNKKDDGVLFSLQGYFGVVAGIFVLAIAGFIGTLVIPVRVRKQRTTSPLVTETQPISAAAATATATTTSLGAIEMEQAAHYTNECSVKSKQSSSYSDGNCSDTFGSNEPLVCPSNNKRQLKNHGSISNPVSSSSFKTQQQNVEKQNHFMTHLSMEDDDAENDDIEGQQQQYVSSKTDQPRKPSSSSPFSVFLRMSKRHWTLNCAQCVLNVLTFFLPGVVPFSVQHYDDSQRALHFLTVTQLLGQTLGIVCSGYYQNTSVVGQLLLFVLLWVPTVTFSIINDTEFQSIQQHSAVPITINALLQFLYGYSSTTFFHLVNQEASTNQTSSRGDSAKPRCDNRGDDLESPMNLDPNSHERHVDSNDDDDDEDDDDNPHIASRVLGTYNQIGAMVGSLVAYFLVEYKVIS